LSKQGQMADLQPVRLNPLDHPVCLSYPRRLTPVSCWHEHIPFAMLLVDILRPATFVELGTASGDSYCAFCQAVQETNVDARCYAVDTWRGDLHSGLFGPEVLRDLRAHHDGLYGTFSQLVQGTFDEALQRFADGEIDLLHVDGCHTYDAVKHDFETWLPKLSPRGVILFHDTNVRGRGFEVWRFWKEVSALYPHLEFLHGYGLGVLAVGRSQPPELEALLGLSDEELGRYRHFFSGLGHRVAEQFVSDSRNTASSDALNAMRMSRSWRITEPLRFVSRLLREAAGFPLHLERRFVSAIHEHSCSPVRAFLAATRQLRRLAGPPRRLLALLRRAGPRETARRVVEYAVSYGAIKANERRTAAAREGMRLDLVSRGAARPFSVEVGAFKPPKDSKIAIVVHVYHMDIFAEVVSLLCHMPVPYSLMISTRGDRERRVIARRVSRLPLLENADIRVVPNRGRDIAPLLVDFGPRMREFDYICHVHTKKGQKGSYELERRWREHLYRGLLGSKERIQAILSVLAAQPSVGLIYPETYHELPYSTFTWRVNGALGERILKRLGVEFDPDEYIDMPAGSMFWARREALDPLLRLQLRREDFPEERGQLGAGLQHVIESCFVAATHKRGLAHLVILEGKGHRFSHRDHRCLQQYLATPFEAKLHEASRRTALVSFAIFDTLLVTPFASRDMVLEFLDERVAAHYGVTGFRELRGSAERIARERKGSRGDVCLSEIYSVLGEQAGFDTATIEGLMAFELSTEARLLAPREEVVQALGRLRASGRRVILVSDTHMDRVGVERVLSDKGISYDALYVSCDTGKRKDRGDLWDHVVKHEPVGLDGAVHVGDNELSDVHVVSTRTCLRPVHVMKPSVLFRQSQLGGALWDAIRPRAGWRENLLYGLVANHFCSDPSGGSVFDPHASRSPTDLGYAAFGPMVFDFLTWLVRSAHDDRLDELGFVSRGGFSLRQAFEALARHEAMRTQRFPKVTDFPCSRRAASFASLSSVEDTACLVEGSFRGSLRAFFEKRLGVVDLEAIEAELGAQALGGEVRLPDDRGEILAAIVRVIDVLKLQAKEEREAFLQYYEQEGLASAGNVGLVDVGFTRTAKERLDRLLGRPLPGYYLVRGQRGREPGSLSASCRVWSGESDDSSAALHSVQRPYLLLEAVLAPRSRELLRCRRSPEGVSPLFAEETLSPAVRATMESIHCGIVGFIEDMTDAFAADALSIEFPKDTAMRCYKHMVTPGVVAHSIEQVVVAATDSWGEW